jgi:hypothetical protein
MRNHTYIDSSDEEETIAIEQSLKNTILKAQGYTKYIITQTDIINSTNTDNFKIKLGLMLQHFADRISRSDIFRQSYHKLKSKYLYIDSKEYTQNLSEIKQIIDTSGTNYFENFDQASLNDKAYIQIFNSLFNPDIEFPNLLSIKSNYTEGSIKDDLIKNLQSLGFKFSFLNRSPLSVNSNEAVSAVDCLNMSKLLNRYNKDKIKFTILKLNKKTSVSNTIELKNSEKKYFQDNNIIHPATKNIQNAHPSQGNYTEIFGNLPQDTKLRKLFIDYTLSIMNNKVETSSISSYNFNQTEAEDLWFLMFVLEAQRNNTSILTSPMFLSSIDKNNNYNYIDLFPMALKNAVSSSRDIGFKYSKLLLNKFTLDYDTSNSSNGDSLLNAEGNLFLTWLKENSLQKDQLNNIASTFDVLLFLSNFKVSLSKNENITIKYVINIISSLKTVDFLANDILRELEISLETLQTNLSNRTQQYEKYSLEKFLNSSNPVQLIENAKSFFTFFESKKESILALIPALENYVESNLEQALNEAFELLISKFNEWYNIDISEVIPLKTSTQISLIEPEISTFNLSSENEEKDLSLKRPSSHSNLSEPTLKSSFGSSHYSSLDSGDESGIISLIGSGSASFENLYSNEC